jgi:hypothetical protein
MKMSSYTNIFGGGVINNADSSYIALTLTESVTLSWVTQFQDVNTVVYNIMDVVSNGAFNITMPDATETSVGQSVLFTNVGGSNSFSVLDNAGGNIFTLAPGNARFLYLTANSTAAGTWRSVPYASGTPSVTSVEATSSSSNLTIGGSPIINAGTFTFGLANDLASLTGFANLTGIGARITANTWALVTITGTANQIVVTGGNGNDGDGHVVNPTLSLPSTITGINSLTVGNLVFSGNSIDSNNAGNVIIDDPVLEISGSTIFVAADGIHYNQFTSGNQTFYQRYIWPIVAPVVDQILQFGPGDQLQWTNVTPTFGGPSTINAIAKYVDLSGSLGNSGVIIDGSNNVTGANSVTARNVQISVADANTISTVTSHLKLIPNGTSEIQVGVISGTPNDLVMMNGGGVRFQEVASSGTSSTIIVQAPIPPASGPYQYRLPSIGPLLGSVMRTTGLTPAITSDLVWDNSIVNNNFLVNGSMSIWQRGTSFTNATFFVNNNNVYTADCWKLQSNGNNIVSVSRDAGPVTDEASCPYSWKATVVNGNTKFGIVQFIENKDTLSINGFITSIGFSAKGTGGITNLRAALIQWSGAADSVTSSVVSAWEASGTNPTLSANWTYATLATGVTVNIPITSSFANYTTNPDGEHWFTAPTGGTNNLAVFIWVDNTVIGVGDTLNLSAIKLEQGAFSTRFIAPPFSVDLEQSKRYFQKDLPYDIAVGTTGYPGTPTVPISVASKCYWPVISPVLTGVAYAKIDFDEEMRTIPGTFVRYPWTTTTSDGVWSDNTGADLAANSASTFALDAKGAIIYNNVTAAGSLTTAGASVIIGHWYADAGL